MISQTLRCSGAKYFSSNMLQWITLRLSRGHSAIFPAFHRWTVMTTSSAFAIGIGITVCFTNNDTSVISVLGTPHTQDDTAGFLCSDISLNKADSTHGFNYWYNQLSRSLRIRSETHCETDDIIKGAQGDDKIIFLGSGSSTGCPRPLCPLLFSELAYRNDDFRDSPETSLFMNKMKQHCRTSILASVGHPVENKDYRNNPSLLISVSDKDTNARKNVVIDVGKTFREGALRWLPRNGIRSVDAIILTHEHMDAAGGLDDVRGFQKYTFDQQSSTGQQQPMPLFLSDICLPRLQDQFPWLLPKPKLGISNETGSSDSSDGPIVVRHVASFDVNVFQPFQPFYPVPGFSVTPLPVMHGEDLVSYGFAFTLGESLNVVYLSDISRMLPETLTFIQTQLPHPIHVLVLDSLLVDSTNPVHFCLPQSLELIQQLQPVQTYLVGMNCDSFGPHDETNEKLRQAYGNVQLAHDGLIVEVLAGKSSS